MQIVRLLPGNMSWTTQVFLKYLDHQVGINDLSNVRISGTEAKVPAKAVALGSKHLLCQWGCCIEDCCDMLTKATLKGTLL